MPSNLGPYLMARNLVITADGGSRGNPGPAAYGAVVFEDGKVLAELFESIGVASNNVAEYNGLIAGLRKAHEIDPQANIQVMMDSKLVVEQMTGRWQIKHPDMRELAKIARDIHPMNLITFAWIPREENSHADRLANKALDGASSATLIRKNYQTDRLLSTEKATTLYLVRHGETIFTPERRFSGYGKHDPELSPRGLEQAAQVAEVMPRYGADMIIASPLMRTMQTAEKIAAKTGLSITQDKEWVEASFGEWDGLSPAEVREKWPEDYELWLSRTDFRPPGGESYEEVLSRIDALMVDIVDRYPEKKIIVVTHSVVIRAAVINTTKASTDSYFHMDPQPCGITTIDIWPSDGLRIMRGFNERTHIK